MSAEGAIVFVIHGSGLQDDVARDNTAGFENAVRSQSGLARSSSTCEILKPLFMNYYLASMETSHEPTLLIARCQPTRLAHERIC